MGDGRAPAQLPSLLSAAAPLFSAPVFWTMSTTRLKGLIEKMKSRRQAETGRGRSSRSRAQTHAQANGRNVGWITDGSDGWGAKQRGTNKPWLLGGVVYLGNWRNARGVEIVVMS